jgi:hypothetical protein
MFTAEDAETAEIMKRFKTPNLSWLFRDVFELFVQKFISALSAFSAVKFCL